MSKRFYYNKEAQSRFEVELDGGGLDQIQISVIKDKETGVQYCLVHRSSGSSGGGLTMTPLLDANGKPLIGIVEKS